MILKVEPGLEGLVAMRAGKRPDVVVDRVDVSRQPTLLGEVLSTELAADLTTDAVGAKVVAEGVPVRVTLLAHVADQLLSLKVNELVGELERNNLYQMSKRRESGWLVRCPATDLMCEAVDSKSRLVHKLLGTKVAIQQSLLPLLLAVIV